MTNDTSATSVRIASLLTCAAMVVSASPGLCQSLSPDERAIVAYIDTTLDEHLSLLERAVNINSGTNNHEGVRRVGAVFAAELDALGFVTRWVSMPDSVASAGHLFAERRGEQGRALLLIGHLDTVFEEDSPFQSYERDDSIARGPGVSDMKGGDVVVIWALSALHAVGALENTSITVAFTGDEEQPGRPIAVSREPLLEAAREVDAALAFEGGSEGLAAATVARRGFSGWVLRVEGRAGHSSLVFSDRYGAGAIYEAARILNSFYRELAGEQYLTFNPGLIIGGTEISHDPGQYSGTAFGKTNVIAGHAVVAGDLRTLSLEQREAAKARMHAIVETGLPGATATIEFDDSYPPMAPTEGNLELLSELDRVSRDLGIGPVDAYDPGRRGAADVSFVAPLVAGLDGLGVVGFREHSEEEYVDLTTLPDVVKRAALLIYRLTRPGS